MKRAGMTRRDFLRAMAAGVAGAGAVLSQEAAAWERQPSVLWLERKGEAFVLDFETQEGYEAARYLLRDDRARMMGQPSAPLLYALARTQSIFAASSVHRPYIVHSGMRTKATNDHTEGSARFSEHLPNGAGFFNAADVRLFQINPDLVGRVALSEGAHGVGFYTGAEFIHIDGGRLRADGTQRVWRHSRQKSRG